MKKSLIIIVTALLMISNTSNAVITEEAEKRILRKLCPTESNIQKVVLDKIQSGTEDGHKMAAAFKEDTKVKNNKYIWTIQMVLLEINNESDKEMLAKANALLHSSKLVYDGFDAVGGHGGAAIFCLYKPKSKANKYIVRAFFGNNPKFDSDQFARENS